MRSGIALLLGSIFAASAAHAQYVPPPQYLPFIDAVNYFQQNDPGFDQAVWMSQQQIIGADEYYVLETASNWDYPNISGVMVGGTPLSKLLAGPVQVGEIEDYFWEGTLPAGQAVPWYIAVANPIQAPELGLDGAALTLLVGGLLVLRASAVPEFETIQSFIGRGYELTVKWRAREARYHAFVDLGSTATSRNFMAPSVKEALEGLEYYLRSLESVVP